MPPWVKAAEHSHFPKAIKRKITISVIFSGTPWPARHCSCGKPLGTGPRGYFSNVHENDYWPLVVVCGWVGAVVVVVVVTSPLSVVVAGVWVTTLPLPSVVVVVFGAVTWGVVAVGGTAAGAGVSMVRVVSVVVDVLVEDAPCSV